MNLPAASSGVSKYQPHKTNLAASCGELTPIEIRQTAVRFKNSQTFNAIRVTLINPDQPEPLIPEETTNDQIKIYQK